MSALIYKQISLVMADITAIGKSRRNQAQGYSFRGIDDVYNDLHGTLAKHGVFTTTEVLDYEREERQTKTGGVMTYMVMRIRFKFYAADGSFVECVMIGEGADTGDKSANKGMSVAHKYALMQVFAIPTEDIKDPEVSSPEFTPKEMSRPTPQPAAPKASATVDPSTCQHVYLKSKYKVGEEWCKLCKHKRFSAIPGIPAKKNEDNGPPDNIPF